MKKTIVVLILLGIFVLGCVNNNQTDKVDKIKLGSILILTGEGASWGEAARNGIDLAINDINVNGGLLGKEVEVNHQDNAANPNKAVTAFQHLTDAQGIDIIIGPSWSRSGLALVDLADEKQTIVISPSLGMADFNEGSEYLFNTWPHDSLLSTELANLVYSKGIRTVALIGAQDVWVKDQTNAFKKQFEQLGGTIKVIVEPDPSNKDVYTEALLIKQAKGLDAIVSTTDGVAVGTLVAKKARELGVDLPIYSITIDQNIINLANGAYEDLEYLTSLTPTEAFQQRYETEYNRAIEIGADSAYDAVLLIADAIESTGTTDTTVLKDYLNNFKEYEGVSGHLISDGKGGFTKDFVLKKVIDNKPVTITG